MPYRSAMDVLINQKDIDALQPLGIYHGKQAREFDDLALFLMTQHTIVKIESDTSSIIKKHNSSARCSL